ncbi:low temperature requirement protein A [Actinomyces viscosus]|uniref:Predicted membrane protein n=1 Tax=Actinomyces viscosus TaxID=1656 RepID=A0A448PJ43_ACTVI|nr:low temperature requirement protein A [Actinomyces viscosus]VEI14957.1 Predicted membrane protein [Actinomyces viscosus]
MTTQDATEHQRNGSLIPHRAVDPIMLFFDLVYVFLITELNGVVRGEPGWRGLAHAGVLLVLIYWQWTLVTVQLSIRDASSSRHRFVVMLLMMMAIINAVALPEAFGDRALVFAAACWGSRLVITFLLARGENSSAFRMDLTSSLVQGPLILGGALLGGNGQLVLWALAALVELSGPLRHGRSMSAQSYDVANIVERFSLLIIVALGETIVSITTPQTELEHLTWLDLTTLVAAFILVGGLWWSYFHHSLGLVEHFIGQARTPFLAVRNLLVYGHLVLVGGLIALAVGLHHVMAEPLHHVPMETTALLCGGAVVFFAMFAVVRLRTARKIYRARVTACLLGLLLIPVGSHVSGAVLVGLLALIAVAEGIWETLAPASAGVPDPEELAGQAAQR